MKEPMDHTPCSAGSAEDGSPTPKEPGLEVLEESVSPARQMVYVSAIVFLAELLVMAIVHREGSLATWLADAGLLLLAIFPALYLLTLRPLRRQIAAQRRYAEAQASLAARLRESLETIETLRGVLPICCVCKKVRDDDGEWWQVEEYVRARSAAEFTHGYCPACLAEALRSVEAASPLRRGDS